MPRPHSPDCLLWAQTLKDKFVTLSDEHGQLKTRMTELAAASKRQQTEIESLRAWVDKQTTQPGEDQKRHANALESLAKQAKGHSQALEGLKTRTVSVERDFVELITGQQQLWTLGEEKFHKLDELAKTLDAVKSKTDAPRGSFAKKDDVGDARVLHGTLVRMQNDRANDVKTMQTMQKTIEKLSGQVLELKQAASEEKANGAGRVRFANEQQYHAPEPSQSWTSAPAKRTPSMGSETSQATQPLSASPLVLKQKRCKLRTSGTTKSPTSSFARSTSIKSDYKLRSRTIVQECELMQVDDMPD
jgi:hypothetical protein